MQDQSLDGYGMLKVAAIVPIQNCLHYYLHDFLFHRICSIFPVSCVSFSDGHCCSYLVSMPAVVMTDSCCFLPHSKC